MRPSLRPIATGDHADRDRCPHAEVLRQRKAINIKLHTVPVINGDVALLKGCATKPSMYCDIQRADADQINNVFSSIAQNLANLRINH